MKRICQKGLSILLALCMVLALISGLMLRVKADGIADRSAILDLSAVNVTYFTGEDTASGDPTSANITDTMEGWSWYHDGSDTPYSDNTLVLNGIDLDTSDMIAIQLPAGSTIVLADGSVNNVRSTYSGTGGAYGIYCPGALTVRGTTGILHVASGTSLNSGSTAFCAAGNLAVYGGSIDAKGGQANLDSIGLLAAGSLTISGGNIEASAGTARNSIGISCYNSVAVTGGNVRAEGKTATNNSYGINSYNTVTFSGGTIYAKSAALASMSYAVYGTSGITDNGMTVSQKDGESDYTVAATKSGSYYVYNTSTLATDIRITQGVAASAAVSDLTVTGKAGTALSGTGTLTVTLTGCTFMGLSAGNNVSGWFGSLPGGIGVSVGSVTGNTATLVFSGTPTGAVIGSMSITIPGGMLSTGSNLAVTANSNAKFEIKQRQRTTGLDLNTNGTITYYTTSGGTASANPTSTNITNTSEGWSWYHDGTDTPYSTNTLVLDGIDLVTSDRIPLQLPAGSTIVLADDSNNTVQGTYNSASGSGVYGIYCWGALAVRGTTGILHVASGTSSDFTSTALCTAGNLTIYSGNIDVKGGQAYSMSVGLMVGSSLSISGGNIEALGGRSKDSSGIFCVNSVAVTGGNVRAEGNTALNNSYGIYSNNTATFSDGTVTALGGTGASDNTANTYGICSSNAVQVTGGIVTAEGRASDVASYGIYSKTKEVEFSGGTIYATAAANATPTYAVYGFTGITDTGMQAFQKDESDYSVAVTKSGAYYVYNTDTNANDLKITQAPGATVSDLTLTGMMGTALSDTGTLTVTLTGCTFIEELSFGDGVSEWFENLPNGLGVSVGSITATTATLSFSGTPAATSSAVMLLTIPGGMLSTGSDLAVTANSNAKFDITQPVPRISMLDLTITNLTYTKTGGSTFTANPLAADITNTAEGWSWYHFENEGLGYAANTLVLNGINIDTSDFAAIKVPDGTTIVLADGSSNSAVSTFDGSETVDSFGIFCEGVLTIDGTGNLHVIGGTSPLDYSLGIYSTGNLTISGGTIDTTGGNSPNTSTGMYCYNSVIINGGILTSSGGTGSPNSYGILARSGVEVSGGTVTAIGGDVTDESLGIFSYSSAIFSGGIAYAKSGSANESYAIYAYGGITDTLMEAFQNDGESDYSVAVSNFQNTYVYNTDTVATDIKISTMPVSFTGAGTQSDPYRISSAAQLKEFSDRVNYQNDLFGDKHYKLMNDIVLNPDITNNPKQWNPIGTGNSQSFKGVFDGNGHTVSGLYIDGDSQYTGLFGYINGGTVKNLGLTGGQVASGDPGSYAGSIVGYNKNGTIEDCYNTGTVSGCRSVGGIAGMNLFGHIMDCSNTGAVSGSGGNCYAGGIAGQNCDADLTIVNCYNTGSVSVAVTGAYNTAYVGGIVGGNAFASIKNCYSTGTLSGSALNDATAYIGGIAGISDIDSGTIVENAYWLDGTADYGIAASWTNPGDDTGCTSKTAIEIKAAAFVETLNDNADALKHTYETISSWKAAGNNENNGYPVFGEEPVSHTLTVSGGGIGATANGSYAAGAAVSVSAGTKNGYTFSGWTTSGGGSFANASLADTIFTMPGVAVTITANWTVTTSPGDDPNPPSGNSGNSGGTSTTDVLVNGQSKSAGTTKTETGSDGRTVTTVTVDSDKLKAILASESSGTRVTIPVINGADTAVGRLTGEMVRSMEDKAATLIIQTDSSSYTLPASEININAVSQQFGTQVSLSDITVSVGISEPAAAMTKVVENVGKEGGFTIMAPAVDFTITCTYGGKTVNVSTFNAYVERTIAIPDGVDPSKITTGIVVEPNGTIHHVPTRVTVINGKYYAVINSLTNSTYSVIWNPMEFSDVTKHWAKASINNMGSRMVVTGVGNNSYGPDNAITRAEFAAIVVRALGLEPGTGPSSFNDVDSREWYSGYIQTAVSYGIIKGYTAKTFGPNSTITREQAIAMIARAMKVTGLKVDLTDSEISELIGAYEDGATVSNYAKGGIASCLKTGIVSGRNGNVMAPRANITRAEAAVMVERLLQKSKLI